MEATNLIAVVIERCEVTRVMARLDGACPTGAPALIWVSPAEELRGPVAREGPP